MNVRVGLGLDFHRLAQGRRLVLGGVEVPSRLGLEGHSDADVLAHAVCDALLGAARLGDVGRHFPPGDSAFKGISSMELLGRVRALLVESGFVPVQVDAVVVAERPRLAPHAPSMEACMAERLELPSEQVSVKATTSEGMGALGREEGMAAWAVTLIQTSEARPRK
ncbi:MAG: 2-C-methyl-D-erythritol 2,4-cyclodiphosphate synthase [Candidatus Bipolaricaulota bacterium]